MDHNNVKPLNQVASLHFDIITYCSFRQAYNWGGRKNSQITKLSFIAKYGNLFYDAIVEFLPVIL